MTFIQKGKKKEKREVLEVEVRGQRRGLEAEGGQWEEEGYPLWLGEEEMSEEEEKTKFTNT